MNGRSTIRSVCVFPGSRDAAILRYREATEELARELANRNLRVVYGGASVGLMRVLADAALDAGASVIGVIPRCLLDREIAHRHLTALHVVETMHQRKERMAALSDAFVLLPGGYGSLEEIFEAITWNQLGIHTKPCVILNVDGYYNALLQFLERAVADGLIAKQLAARLLVATTPGEALDLLGTPVVAEAPK
ncbi:TIGR00730 family Rossman fold protein [bacterium]|nr:TIGR00730 family Rossman fold protein [bacterium]